MSLTTIDVPGQLRAASERFATQTQEHDIEIRTEVGPGRLKVRADADRLGQILDNFLSNAIRYFPPGGAVTLSARTDTDAVTVGVTDQGPSLTEEQLERVFERFD